MSQEKEIKFPLSKRQRTKFENDYELIFFKKPVHNISDEKLVEAVQANQSKIGSNAKNSQQQPPQEGTQDKGGQEGNGDGLEGTTDNGTGANTDGKVTPEQERAFQIEKFKELHGTDADENISTSEITALNLTKENFLTGSKEYFDLFGKQPIDEMTTEQILSANANEKARISEANTKKPKAKAEEIKFNPATEMLIQRKGEKRVINKQTFQFIKNDGWEEVVETPSELLNK